MNKQQRRVLVWFLSMIGGSFFAGFFVVFFFMKARRRRRQLIGVSALAPAQEHVSEYIRAVSSGAGSTVETLLENLSKYNETRVSVSGDLILTGSEQLDLLWSWLADNCNLYVIATAQTDEEESKRRDQILSKLSSTKFNKHYLLFCSTEKGRGHIARHFSVSLHVDETKAVLEQLRPFVHGLIRIDANKADCACLWNTLQ